MYESFQQFWPEYLDQHRKPATRQLHFAGTVAGLTLILDQHWVIGILVSYAFAWVGHFFSEGNAPATFRHPILSLIGDFYMCWLLLRGKLDEEAARAAAELAAAAAAQPSLE